MRTDPAIGKAFFPPKKLLAVLRKRLADFRKDYRQNLALVGHRGVGKTSVLANVARSLSGTALTPIYVAVYPEALAHFANRLMGSLLAAALAPWQSPSGWATGAPLRRARRLYPKTVRLMRSVRSLAGRGQNEAALTELFSLPRVLAEEKRAKVVLFLDDFDHLSDLPVPDPFGILGREVMIAKDTLFVVASSRPFRARQILNEKLTLLFGRFDVIGVEPFSWEAAEAFLAFKFRHLALRKRLRRFLFHLSGGIPLHLDALTGRGMAVTTGGALAGIRPDAFIAALRDELFLGGGWLHQYFQGVLEGLQKTRGLSRGGEVLVAVARGHKATRAAAQWLSMRQGEVARILTRLVEEDALVKRGAVYDLPDPLFRFWLSEVLYPRRLHVGLDMEDLVRAFEDRLRREMAAVREDEEKGFVKRLEELMKSFANERVELGEKAVRLPAFDDVVTRKQAGALPALVGSRRGARWVVRVAEDRVSEQHVRSFLEEARALRKGARCLERILIPLRGMELNACILAKEAHVGIWDPQTLNQLFDLYGKSRLVVPMAGSVETT